MINQCSCSLLEDLSQRLDNALRDSFSSCPRNAALSLMDSAARTELLHAKDHCCTLAFMLHLCFCCKDVDTLVTDLRRIVLDVYDRQSNTP